MFPMPVSSIQWMFSHPVADFVLVLFQPACFLWKSLHAVHFQISDLKPDNWLPLVTTTLKFQILKLSVLI